MNKICTDLSQSKKLVELGIDVYTSDMYYHYDYDFDELESIPAITEEDDHFVLFPKDVRCWSLAALLAVLPYPSLHKIFAGWRCDSYNKEGKTCKFGETTDNPVDACYEMILKLNKLKML